MLNVRPVLGKSSNNNNEKKKHEKYPNPYPNFVFSANMSASYIVISLKHK